MKISFINTLLTICLVWAVVFFMLIYLSAQTYDNPSPVKPAYNISEDSVQSAMLQSSVQQPALVTTLVERLAKGNIEHGKEIYSECATCHSAKKDGKNRIGPPLWGILGRSFASVKNFGYSRSMRHAAYEGKQWDFETLYNYLQAPQAYVKGTTMSYKGMKDAQARADLILYLRSLADNFVSLPHTIKSKGDAQ